VITHPEKVLFPGVGITKGELAAYYEAIAPQMVAHICGRPITMERYHRGIQEKGFFQKDVSKGFPEWLERVEVPKKDGTVHHPIVADTRSLVWLANQNSITPHVWTSRVPNLFRPDICVFDLDPSADDSHALRECALGARELLRELGLKSFVKTSGSKGFHIAVPLDGTAGFGEVAGFAHAVGTLLVKRHPDRLTQEFSKADRALPCMQYAQNRVHRCQRRARGRRSKAARSGRERSRCGRWQTGLPGWAIYGPT
jgi:bifunctional non-homologous end joining protein LigD